MKVCPNCQSSFDDSMRFCVNCGTGLVQAPEAPEVAAEVEETATEQVVSAPEAPQPEFQQAPQPEFQQAPQPEFQQAPQYAPPAPGYAAPYQAPPIAPAPNPDDHTPEMKPEDIAENKLYAMLVYLLGPIGIIIALLKDKHSDFLNFHIKLSIRYLVVQTILTVASTILCWTFIVPIAGSVCILIVSVLEIITFVQVCQGKAKDPAIIKNLKFLK